MGHDARIIPARFVKPYVKSNKSDTINAAPIAEAVTRPTMRFVQVRTPEQVDLQAIHRIRDRLVGQRTALMNQARAFCLEYGLAMRVGAGGFHADIRRHLANTENDLTPDMRVLLEELLDDLAYIEGRIKAVNSKVEAYASQHDAVSRLVTIPGIGVLGATAIMLPQVTAGNSERRAIWLRGWGWFRQSIRPGANRPFLVSANEAIVTCVV
jgi:transposase